MAKGISSRHSLKALAYPVQQFITGWGAQARPAPANAKSGAFPAPYELAALRGEGVLRERFFRNFMAKLPVTLDAEQQIDLWQILVEDGGHVTAWVQRLGIAKALRREAALPVDAGQESRKLYCLLLDTLAQDAPEILPWAVEGFFWHLWKAQFPTSAPAIKTKAASIELMREQLIRALRRQYSEAVEVKESFREHEAQVDFALLFKRASTARWEELARQERPRLKTARLAAYDTALQLASTPLPP